MTHSQVNHTQKSWVKNDQRSTEPTAFNLSMCLLSQLHLRRNSQNVFNSKWHISSTFIYDPKYKKCIFIQYIKQQTFTPYFPTEETGFPQREQRQNAKQPEHLWMSQLIAITKTETGSSPHISSTGPDITMMQLFTENHLDMRAHKLLIVVCGLVLRAFPTSALLARCCKMMHPFLLCFCVLLAEREKSKASGSSLNFYRDAY